MLIAISTEVPCTDMDTDNAEVMCFTDDVHSF